MADPLFDVINQQASVSQRVNVGLERAMKVRGRGFTFAVSCEAGVGLDFNLRTGEVLADDAGLRGGFFVPVPIGFAWHAEGRVHHDDDQHAIGRENFAAGAPDGREGGHVLDGEHEGDGVEGGGLKTGGKRAIFAD